ncbi:hypothetical protein BASA81_006908 [Batrachochytrium salamandrivorans]|nr:hypothetical protein BASA81_006908 [Batrachochytrium salamandrivorans]
MELDNEVWTIRVRSAKLPEALKVPVLPNAPLSQLVEFVNERVSLDNSTVIDPAFAKLLSKGRVLDRNFDLPVSRELSDGDTVLLVFTPRAEVELMNAQLGKDNRLRSMEEEDALEAKRLAGLNSADDSQDAVYKFCKFKVVDRFTTPHPFEAMRLLNRLAVDPAIKRIMKTNEWTVGSLEEMDPRTDMISLRKQSEDGACVLGYNENAGHKIFLRLRNDAETEFRSYNSLVNTLLHELAHNVHGPHDEQFWALFAKLKTEYLKFHQVERGHNGAKLDLTDGQVMREIRTQGAGNSALKDTERAAALNLASGGSASRELAAKPLPSRLGAANSRARIMERQKLATAAEKRFAVAKQPPLPLEPNKCDCGEHDPVKLAVAGITHPEAVKLAHTIVCNAQSGEAKFLQVKTTGDKFQRHHSELKLLLLALGFEPKGDFLVLGSSSSSSRAELLLARARQALEGKPAGAI